MLRNGNRILGDLQKGNMRYFITGGAGFIGSHVVSALTQAGHNVMVVDINGKDACQVDICDI